MRNRIDRAIKDRIVTSSFVTFLAGSVNSFIAKTRKYMAIRFSITRGRRIHHRIAGSIESSGVPEEEEDDDKDIEGIVVYSLPSGVRNRSEELPSLS
jgi:hypothetical protein